MGFSTKGQRLFIARHGETVFNAVGRMQGMHPHTPLTREGCEQAVAMGRALVSYVSAGQPLALLASPSGRTLQTLALVAAEIGMDWHAHQTDIRLREIDVGQWEGQYYRDIAPDITTLMSKEHKLFIRAAPGGEDYPAVAARLRDWLNAQDFAADMLVISHGMTARVLRGLLLGYPDLEGFGVPVAPSLAQGSMVMIRDGVETLVIDGAGAGERA
ncbi:MAG: histidine phosphatase family protein [Sphingorhabdus sp.]